MAAMARKKFKRTYIKEWRELLGMTQEELAEAADLSDGYISLLENGERGYTQRSLEQIAYALRRTPGELTNVDPTRDGSIMGLLETLRPDERQDIAGIVQMYLERVRKPREAG